MVEIEEQVFALELETGKNTLFSFEPNVIFSMVFEVVITYKKSLYNTRLTVNGYFDKDDEFIFDFHSWYVLEPSDIVFVDEIYLKREKTSNRLVVKTNKDCHAVMKYSGFYQEVEPSIKKKKKKKKTNSKSNINVEVQLEG